MWTPLKTLTVALGVQHSASKVVAQVAHKDTAKIKLLETAGGHSTLQHASEPGGAIDPDRSLVEASSGQHVAGRDDRRWRGGSVHHCRDASHH
ncbi:unnamed protein product [Ectocarpus sp. 12 AP-2014]